MGRVASLLLVVGLAACRTAPPPIPGSQFATFQSAFGAEDGPTLIAEESFAAADGLFIKYRVGSELGYARAAWPTPPDGDEAAPPLQGNIASLEFYGEFSPDTAESRDILVLGATDWQRVRDRALGDVIPDVEDAGVILRFADDDYFLTYDPAGRFHAYRLEDKPAEYSIIGAVTINELVGGSWRALDDYLAERGLNPAGVLFNTGDVGAYSLPFAYGDMQSRTGLFLRYVPPRTGPLAHAGSATGQTMGHIARSHLTGLLARPFSSIGRLFFVVFDAARDTVRPDWLVTLSNQPVPPLANNAPMDLAAWESRLDQLTGRPGNRGTMRYLIDGEPFFDRFLETATAARESIHLRAYIYDNDDVAARTADLLKRRADEGVDVKVLLDGLGTVFAAGEAPAHIPDYYQPPASMRRYLEQDSDVRVRLAPNPWLTGDHVKTFIIDEEIVFLGGMNVGREYRYEWHDMMVEVQGSVVNRIVDDFHEHWAAAGPFGDFAKFAHMLHRHGKNASDNGYPLRLIYTLPGDSEIFRTQLEAIRAARSYIFIQNSYFTNDTLLYELAKARRRGVDVRVILPLESDIGPLNRDTALVANAMLENGIRVFLYPGMSHIKAAVFDGWACLGSANLDNLSLRINKELNVATSHKPAVDELLQVLFDTDFERSVEMKEPFPERWSDHLLEIFVDYFY